MQSLSPNSERSLISILGNNAPKITQSHCVASMRAATVYEAIQSTIRVILHTNKMMATNERFVLIEPTTSGHWNERTVKRKRGNNGRRQLEMLRSSMRYYKERRRKSHQSQLAHIKSSSTATSKYAHKIFNSSLSLFHIYFLYIMLFFRNK